MQHLHEIVSESVKRLTNTLYVLKLSWEVSTVLVLFKVLDSVWAFLESGEYILDNFFFKNSCKKKKKPQKTFWTQCGNKNWHLRSTFRQTHSSKSVLVSTGESHKSLGFDNALGVVLVSSDMVAGIEFLFTWREEVIQVRGEESDWILFCNYKAHLPRQRPDQRHCLC